MNLFERALTPETYTNAIKDPGSAIKNVVSDPGFGLVAGAMLGMPQFGGFSAMQAALMTGGISALATGSLQKGFMTGLSAYGGAGLGASLSSAGETAIQQGALNQSAAESARLGMPQTVFAEEAARAGAEASALDTISAGVKSAASSPEAALQFAKDNYGKALMAAGPILADKMVATKTPLPTAGSLSGPSYIRPYAMTRKVRQPEKDTGSREQDWFDTTWERGEPYKAANGGIVALADGGMTSQGAYDFLMGKKSDTGSAPLVNTVTQAPTYEGHYEYDAATGTSRFVPARMDMTTAMKPVISTTTPTTPTTDTAGITTLVPGFGNPNAVANQAAAFDAMTPAQKADHQAQLANLSEAMTPTVIKILQQIKQQILNKQPNEPLAPVVNMDTLSPDAIAQQDAAIALALADSAENAPTVSDNPAALMGDTSGDGGVSSGGVSATSGSPMGGIASIGTVGQANAAVAAANAAAANGVGGIGVGGGNAGTGNGGTSSGVGTGIGGLGGIGGGLAQGGISSDFYNLGSYSDGGRLLRGPGDGVSDSIPAMIGKNQPARLADGEFVVPARIVSEIGNGSTEAGARKLYAMMDRIQAARKKTVGKSKVAANTKADKYLPA